VDPIGEFLNSVMILIFASATGTWFSLWLGAGGRFFKARLALCAVITIVAILLLLKTSLVLPVVLVQEYPFIGFVVVTIVVYAAIVTVWEPMEWGLKRRLTSHPKPARAADGKTAGAELRREWEQFKQGWQEESRKEPTIDPDPEPKGKESAQESADEDIYDLYKQNKSEPSSDRNYSEELMDQGGAYVARTHLMSPSERQVYRVLEKAYGDRYRIFCQVRVVDLIQPNTKKYFSWTKEYKSLFRQISQWHFDYVLCEKKDFKVKCVLELDDQSHERPDRKKRDRILNRACEVAGIRLERMKINHTEKRIEIIR